MRKDEKLKTKKRDGSQDFSWLDLTKAILYLVGRDKKKYIFWNIVRFGSFFYIVIPPLILGRVVDFFTYYKDGESLKPFYIYIFFVVASSFILLITRSISKQQLIYIRNAAYRNVRVEGFRNLAGLEFQKTQHSSVGSRVQRIENGMSSIHSVMAILENEIFRTGAVFVGVISVFLFLQPDYVIFFVLYCVFLSVILKAYYKKIQIYSYKRNLAKEKASGIFIEGLNNILTLKVFSAENTFGKLLTRKEADSEKIGNDEVGIILNQWRWFYTLNSLAMGGFLLLVGLDVVNRIITVGMIVVLFSYIEKLINNASGVVGVYQDFLGAKNGIARMMPIFWEDKKVVNGKSSFPDDWSGIKLKNIKFIYKKEEQDKFHMGIKKVDLSIRKNTKIGFVGKTGSGKSTLAKLLVGLYEIDSGEYLIGDEKFSNIKTEELLKNISIVLQESEMFNLSLKENITLMHRFDKKLFDKAIKIAQLEDVVKKMPKGVKTFIGEKGYHLSGGERQRVGIARAIYRNTPIMIFDEATSSLDNRTEKLIQEGIEREMEQKTLIFIAHRITTLKNVDNIYVFKNGRIVEDGKYDELLSRKEGEFYKLFKK